jgi:2-polyprenyl-3-methyl-5-hydroxy-6-metoxy-1,4-benzoquinol methylase
MEIIHQCPVCETQNFISIFNCKDYLVSNQEFSIVECKNCSFRFTNPRPFAEDLGRYYESENYISHSNTNSGLIDKIYQVVRQYTISQKIKLLNQLGKKGQLLDIGCGTGDFLNAAKQDGWNVEGIEPGEKARNFAIAKHGLKVGNEKDISSLKEKKFDVITLWHVLEHVPYLNIRIKEIKTLLKEKGTLIIAVPNCASRDANHYKNYWAAYDVPRHLYHFTPSTIEKLFNKHNLLLLQKLPMKFDSFYVSLLSEKYKNGESGFISAFFNGLRSNMQAMSTGNYSSLIYIFKHH